MSSYKEQILYGVKSKNASVKVIQIDDNEFIVEEKHYFFGFNIKTIQFEFDKLESAEDKFLSIRDTFVFK